MELRHTTLGESGMAYCSCGCGERVGRNGLRFIHGHHRRGVPMTKEHKEKISRSRIGYKTI